MLQGLRRLWTRSPNRLPARRRSQRPSLESLEDRYVLTAFFRQTNLVSDIAGLAAFTDSSLVNPWGIAFAPGGPFWIANNNSGASTLYDPTGRPQPSGFPLIVGVPTPVGQPNGVATPDGIVFNSTADFSVSFNGKSGPSTFIFATEDGTIAGWNQGVDAFHAVLAVPSPINGAVYKGLALASNANGNFLFAANFNSGTIDVFDKNFTKVNLAGSFTDPNLPAGFAPFNVENVNGTLFVTYAKQDAAKHDPVAGAGNGFVDMFDTTGKFIKRFASQGTLNAPWGLATAPAGFGAFGGDILVGNFGDGRISAYNSAGTFQGQLPDAGGNPLSIDGLWALTFGGGASAGDPNTLYVTAGLDGEAHGLFASLAPATMNERFIAQLYLDLLHRAADPGGLAFFSQMLNSGATRAQVVTAMERSQEFDSVTVQTIYNKFLHRAADPTGLTAFTNLLASGTTIEQVEALIAGSQEYFQVRGGSTTNGFLTALYQDALGRVVDASGQAFFTGQLGSGTTRTQVATEIFSSGEFRQDLVQGFYQSLLHRAADAGGLAFFLNAVNNGNTDQQIIALMAGSDEYFSRV
jgi:uncharacterized protein (TIGR03118 family)